MNGAGYGVIFKGTGQDWRYTGGASSNVFVNCAITGGYAKGVRNTAWFNNTCYVDPSHTAVGLIEVGANIIGNTVYESTGTRLRYNILYGKTECYLVALMSSGSLPGLDSDYNCLWSDTGVPDFYCGGLYKSMSDWQALGCDKHSMLKDPMFVNPDIDDFRLRSGSPCINPDTAQSLDLDDSLFYVPQFSYGALQPVPAGS